MPRKYTRRKTSKQTITITLPPKILAVMRAIAERKRTSVSAILSELATQWVCDQNSAALAMTEEQLEAYAAGDDPSAEEWLPTLMEVGIRG